MLLTTKYMNTIQESASKIQKPYSRTNFVKHSLHNKGVNIWNGLNTDLKNLKSYCTFKKNIKKLLLAVALGNIVFRWTYVTFSYILYYINLGIGLTLIDISNFLLIRFVSDYERMRRTYFCMNVVLKGTAYFGIYD